MNQGPRYIPVLRTKPAEWNALRSLAVDVRQAITPRLEVLPAELDLIGHAASPGLPRAFQKFAIKIRRSWGSATAFVDFSRLSPSIRSDSGEHPLTLFGRAAASYGVNPILTLGPYDDSAFLLAAREFTRRHKFGVAVRLHYGDLDKETVTEETEALLSALGVNYSDTDVFVDCGVVDDVPPDYDWLCSRIPHLARWRNFIVTGGSFPENLEGMAIGARVRVRYEWLHWQAWALAPRLRSVRVPHFSDYTIQHAVYEPPEGGRPSASIRYTAETYWLIMRGEAPSKKNGGSRQYYGNARFLCERDEFKGSTYSFGDQYISDAANRRGGPGTPATWITAGVSHHITLAARQVAAVHE